MPTPLFCSPLTVVMKRVFEATSIAEAKRICNFWFVVYFFVLKEKKMQHDNHYAQNFTFSINEEFLMYE